MLKRLFGISFNNEVKKFNDLSLNEKKNQLNKKYLDMLKNGVITQKQYNVFVKVYDNHNNNSKKFMKKNSFNSKKQQVRIRPEWLDSYEKETEEHSRRKQQQEEEYFKNLSEEEKSKIWDLINSTLKLK